MSFYFILNIFDGCGNFKCGLIMVLLDETCSYKLQYLCWGYTVVCRAWMVTVSCKEGTGLRNWHRNGVSRLLREVSQT